MLLTAEQQRAALAHLRESADASERAIRETGGDYAGPALYSLGTARRFVDALDRTAELRRSTEEGSLRWYADAEAAERIIASLPGDAREGTLRAVLENTARATVTQVAEGAGEVVKVAGSVAGAALSALPLSVKVGGALVLVLALALAGWQVKRLVLG